MSTTSTTDDSDLQVEDSISLLPSIHLSTLFRSTVTHVFLPAKLPDYDDYTLERDLSLVRTVCTAAHAYHAHVNGTSELQWHRITKMLDNLQASVQYEHLDKGHVMSQLREMQVGDILTLFIGPHDAVIVLTKRENSTLFESFELSPSMDAIERTARSLICSYPCSAVEVPNEVFDDGNFQSELTSFLSRPDTADLNLPPPPVRPQYIVALLSGILRGVGHAADVPRITKRVRDHVGWPQPEDSARVNNIWRRSSLWLLIRVVIQMSVDRSPHGRALYKGFMLFFMCTLAGDGNNANLSSDLLHLMLSKIFRRSSKLGSPSPDWLSKMAQKTCTCLQEILDARWKQLSTRGSPFRNPTQDELIKDTQLSLLHSREYIRDALAKPSHHNPAPPFRPSHCRRGTINDFLSSNETFSDWEYYADRDVILYDVEQSVSQGIDDWVASVTNVVEACAQLEMLMVNYYTSRSRDVRDNPEEHSIMFLTVIQLFVALDKLVVKEIPMLADYSPEIPVALLEKLLLRETTNLHRLACVYQYLDTRLSQSRPGWSILSNEFTKDSFAVRYYDQSPHLQHLKARIEQDAMEKVTGHVGLQRETTDLTRIDDGFQACQQRLSGQRLVEGAEVSYSPLPASPLLAKVVTFEVQCPACVRIWRSAVIRVLQCASPPHCTSFVTERRNDLLVLAHVPELRPYFIECEGGPSSRPSDVVEFSWPPQLQFHLAYLYQTDSQYRNSLRLCCALQYHEYHGKYATMLWRPKRGHYDDWEFSSAFRYKFDYFMDAYVNSTSHTPNDVLAAQARCPANLSLDEFTAFAHLRSGGSLQWVNILRGLRSRTLNLRRDHVYFLLAKAVFQVGPLDPNTGTWIWHQDLQDSSFCNALLDELDSLFVEIGAGLIDGVMMKTISLLLTRMLSSSPSEGASERVITLLRSVRRRTFEWVQELSYNLAKAPTNKERARLLCDMAATCRSTFDVDPATLRKLLQSAEDVDAALSCDFLVQTLRYGSSIDDTYLEILLRRDRRLSLTLEGTLTDVILGDASDSGIDLAVGKIFASHKPSTHRWERLEYPNTRWLTCKTKATMDQPSQMLHVNLLNGALLVDGQILGGLPPSIGNSPEYQKIFHDQGFFVIPSNLPGMDFTTLAMASKYRVHFSLRPGSLVIRAQCNETNDILELIPSSKLQGDLPSSLINGHIHWLNLSTKIIEIRPLDLLWEQSSENWRIYCASEQYHLDNGREILVDIRSPTWAMISQCFMCLNDAIVHDYPEDLLQSLLITASRVNTLQSAQVLRLSVALPHYDLSFFVNECGDLESRDFRNMVYDENQCVGALFGLENLLVLRQKTLLAEDLITRRIIIPNGSPKQNNHQDTKRLRMDFHCSPKYYTYNVDAELGCLTGDGSLRSTQYLAYLHAMTSWHRPDPLTAKTGVQAALCLLQSAGCRSIMILKALNYNTDWRSTQYPQINIAHQEIEHRYYWNRNVSCSQAPQRATRAAQRAAHIFPCNATGLTSLEDCEDMDYLTPEFDSELESVAFSAASTIYHWSINAPTILNIISNWAELWSRNMPVNMASSFSQHDGPGTPSYYSDLVQTLMIKVHDILEKSEKTRQRFQLLFLLPALAYCLPSYQIAFFSMLIAFAGPLRLQSCLGNTPIHVGYRILDGYHPSKEVLWDLIYRSSREKRDLWSASNSDIRAAVEHLLKDWPSDTLPMLSLDPRFWDVASLTASLQQLFSSCYRNFTLKEHLMDVLAKPGLPTLPRWAPSPQYMGNEGTPLSITLDRLLFDRPAPVLPPHSVFLCGNYKSNETWLEDIPALDLLFSSLQTESSFQREYITRLNASARHMREEPRVTHSAVEENVIEALKRHYARCRVNYTDCLAALQQSLGPTPETHEQALERFGQWPFITADVLLRYLASTSPITLPERWKKCLVSLALLLLELQHARRLLRLALDGLEEEFAMELENKGCDGWNPEEHPDWLLIQVQGNFRIRRAQVEAAREIISPQSGYNTVMQVNMGEGKSSVIIPIAAAALADGKQLVRVIVPKALTVQMFELLVTRLGGLVNRPIYHLPFTRSPDVGFTARVEIDDLRQLMSQCMAERGILLVQPEHVVSLKLMSVEEQISEEKIAADPSRLQKLIYKFITPALSLNSASMRIISTRLPEDGLVGKMFQWLSQSPNRSNKADVAQADHHDEHSGDAQCESGSTSKWLNLQKWIHRHVRDILDESDEILHTRFQLIYTIGHQQHMDGYPERWTITQQVLRLVKEHVHTLSRQHPNSIEYERGPPGSFPHVRIVRAPDVGRHLISLIVGDVMAGRLSGFDFQHVSLELRDAIHRFISDEDVLQTPDAAKRVEEYAKDSHQSHMWSGLLLLRGLLASNILLFALGEWRWRVEYGLQQVDSQWRTYSSTGTMLAVPYRAKDIPAPNAQFGHPDVTIILTCLSYYYGGLSEAQLRVCFEILLDQDDPYTEYALWVKEYESVPGSLQKLGEFNLKSSDQWDKEIFPLFSQNQVVIDLYLSQVVFATEAKEFPWKISGSSWDLAEKRERVITGFSGTNDGQWLLPTSIFQHDHDHQQGNNARVLAYLLRPENDAYTTIHESGERPTTLELLQMIARQQPEIRVLLDVGAQILDLSNQKVAKAWLSIARDISGAIYFNENHEMMVLTRNGVSLPMLSSSLSRQLDRCVVYLDHAHTRGTDIKLPIGSRAVVTLGPKVTKDRLVQGCMRMRKLGHGHSVMFFAPPEVDQSIRAMTGRKDPNTRITTVDILCWAIHETWADIQQRAPYWAQQGMSHKSRHDAWSRFVSGKLTREKLEAAWLQPEYKSLADLYAPSEGRNTSSSLSGLDPDILQHCKDLGVLSLPTAQMAEEQEREVNREREREREVELPPEAKPEEHFLHQDVVTFVKTGVIPPLHSGSAFLPVFTALEKSSAATGEADVWSPFILATADFCKTVKPESTRGTMDQYLRPVQWILSNKKNRDQDQVLVLLSPFEADRLMPDIRASEYVHLHVYTPRTSQRMKPSDDLKLYSIPPLPCDWTPPWALIDQLNVFAGQLYLRDYTSYLRLCHFLGAPTKELSSDTAVRWNLFNILGSFEETEIKSSSSPLPSVMALLAIRNRGRPFAQTHMGKILQGQVLTAKDFEGPTSIGSGLSPTTCDKHASRDVTFGTMPPSPSDKECDARDGPRSSVVARLPKRGLEMAEISDADSEPQEERLRAD